MPRTMPSIGTPSSDARYSSWMISGSEIELFLMTMPAGRPARACAISRSTRLLNRTRNETGATSSARYSVWREYPVR